MKKVKIMLMSLAVLAIVGGALAFKASKFTDSYCSIKAQFTVASPANIYYCPDDPAWVGAKVCADLINVRTLQRNGVAFTTNVCTTPKPAGVACAAIENCIVKTTVYQDN